MTTTHTPGPLEVSKHATPEHSPQYGVYAEDKSSDHAIFKGENAKADATLYAAAPDLLAALERIASQDYHGQTQSDGAHLAAIARAAIDKATN